MPQIRPLLPQQRPLTSPGGQQLSSIRPRAFQITLRLCAGYHATSPMPANIAPYPPKHSELHVEMQSATVNPLLIVPTLPNAILKRAPRSPIHP